MNQPAFVAGALALFGLASLQAAALYGVTDLGPGYDATSINNQGTIAGICSPGTVPGSRAFTYSNGQVLLLSTLVVITVAPALLIMLAKLPATRALLAARALLRTHFSTLIIKCLT